MWYTPPMPAPLIIDGHSLTVPITAQVAAKPVEVGLAPEARQRMEQSRRWVEELIARGDPVYGINTGFGVFSDRSISPADTLALQRNLILSHAAGIGEPFAPEITRAAMLIRANTLALGHSGVRADLVDTLLAMLMRGVTPIIPSQGSLGSSGDLAALSHLALVMSSGPEDREEESGCAWYQGQVVSGKAALSAAGIPRLVLGPKEALALNNGAAFSAALGVLAVARARRVLAASEVALALVLEALRGAADAFDQRLHAARSHAGQQTVAANIRRLIAGSSLVGAAGRVQDAYSIRCAPQVIGPAHDTLDFVTGVLEREINAATDNPLLFDGQAVSGGNFHGEVIGQALDFAAISLAEVGAIAERRIARLIDEKLNDGLPPMLVASHNAAGLHSGLMMLHYTAAALVLENQTLASADSLGSLPTSANQEDHNANSATAGRHLQRIVDNLEHIVAIELLAAAQAIDLRLRQSHAGRLAPATSRAQAIIRDVVPFFEKDQLYPPAIQALRGLITDGAFSAV
jgi:histidine ammonia-lyase